MMKKLLLSVFASATSLFVFGQCSVDTIPNADNGAGICYMNDVIVNSSVISSASGYQPSGVSYQSFSAPYVMLRQDEIATYDFSFSSALPVAIYVWVDFNNDGIYSSTEIAAYATSASGPFANLQGLTPVNVMPDTVHMRVTIQQGAGGWGPGSDDACFAPGFGETEDYLAIIQCANPSGLMFDPIPEFCMADSVLLNANNLYDVAWYAGTPPTLIGTGYNLYFHPNQSSTDTIVYVQSVTVGCFSGPLEQIDITFHPSPVATIIGPDTVRSCSADTIYALPGPYMYSWSYGGIDSAVVITSGYGGNLTLTTTAPSGCFETDMIYVNIAPDPPGTYASVVPGGWYCYNLEVYLTYDSSIAPGTCSWYSLPGNTLVGSGSFVADTLPAPGTYQYMGIINSSCGPDTVIRTIVGNYGAVYDSLYMLNSTLISNVYTFCYGNTGYMTGILSGLQGTVDHWVLTDVTVGFSMNWSDDDTLDIPTSMATNGHLYSIYAVIVNPAGCYDTTVTVFATPQNTANLNLAPVSWQCSFPATIGYGSLNYGVYDFLWSTGDTTSSIVVPSPMQVTIYAIDHSTGCVTYDTTYVGDASAQTDLFSDTTFVCNGYAYFDPQFIQYSVDFWEEYDSNWNLITTNNSPDYYVNGNIDEYLIFAGYNSHGCYIFDTTYVAFNSTFTFSLGPDITTAVTPVTLNGPTNTGMYLYSWAPVLSSNQTIQVSTSGTYSLTVDNGQGCSYTDVIVVNILPMTVQEVSVPVVNVYPNPANDVVTIQSSANMYEVNILDLNGRIIRAQSCNGNQTEIRIGDLPDGCYIIETKAEEGITRSRLLKQ